MYKLLKLVKTYYIFLFLDVYCWYVLPKLFPTFQIIFLLGIIKYSIDLGILVVTF